MFEIVDATPQGAVIKVIGVGGGGGNAVKHMLNNQVEGVEFIGINTDPQALRLLEGTAVLKIGSNRSDGRHGAGTNPEVGRQAALEDSDRIAEVLEGADMIFITAGLGGGTGTGAAPVIAKLARERGILTVAVVTRPFSFEKKERARVAEQGLTELTDCVDSLISIPNDKLAAVYGSKITILDAFTNANDVLKGAVQGIADLIIRPGLINLDFADVKTVMGEKGLAIMGIGCASGENRAQEAAEAAVRNPLLDDTDLRGARGILVNVTAGPSLSMGEFTQVNEIINELAADDATVVVGAVIDEACADELRVTLVAAGLGNDDAQPVRQVVDNSPPTPSPQAKDLDTPTAIRRKRAARAAQATASPEDCEYLDIPTFIRNQAD
ncbi:MAG: cell division protein FtsZ [Cellvibrionales bacterium]|nr:cell division protein FtsZ [Cellvibrionales bacterium]